MRILLLTGREIIANALHSFGLDFALSTEEQQEISSSNSPLKDTLLRYVAHYQECPPCQAYAHVYMDFALSYKAMFRDPARSHLPVAAGKGETMNQNAIIQGLIILLVVLVLKDRVSYVGYLPGDLNLNLGSLRLYIPLASGLLVGLTLSLLQGVFRG